MLVLVALITLLPLTFVRDASAVVNATMSHLGNGFATTALYAPTGLTATPSGHDVALSWSAGQNGDGYSVKGVSNGTSSDCSAATYSAVGTSASTTYTDTGRYTPQGTYYCYQALTSYGTSWTSVSSNPTAVAQIGVVVTSVVITNHNVAGKIDATDTVAVTFNQPISTGTGPATGQNVCWNNSGTIIIMLGVTASSGTCAATETLSLVKLTGGTSNANGRFNATWAWSNANKTVTMTVGSTKLAGGVSSVAGTWIVNPTTVAGNLLSATGAFHTCDTNTGGGTCLVTATGSF